MKSSFSRNTGIAAVVLSGLLLAGCGQTGPLYMPAPPAKATPKASAPVPLPSPTPTPTNE
ncbi:lipoprotein [Massilia sp. CF038]|uniref:LPS translocon maturation chaperone LptM n=1 Tax=Massilia sp. CF038 TaxID=1881045 RepID=UPI00093411B4|nr:lipoprotein [Massilia sp. CF038]